MKKLLKYLCPHTWFKKKEIVFYSKYPYGNELNPIVKSSEFKRLWVEKSKNDYNKNVLESKNQKPITIGHRCLGINSLFKEGFLIKAHSEFAIETNGIEDDIKIHCNRGVVDLSSRHKGTEFSFFPPYILGDYTRPFGALKSVIKIESPWFIETPKDVVLLILPVYYADDNRFIATPAIHDPMYAIHLNVMLWWFIKNGYETIRKGTPLAQAIPIPRKNICESFKMVDFVPEKIYKRDHALEIIKTRTRCPIFSEFKEVAEKLYDFKK